MRWISNPLVQWLSRVLGYLLAITALTWPLMGHLSSMLPGFPNVDSGDTVWLRGLIGPTLLNPTDKKQVRTNHLADQPHRVTCWF
jgi:hypothetical protein